MMKECGNEFKLKRGYFCERPEGHEGKHYNVCPNPEFGQSWSDENGKPVPAPPSSATKHQICGLCGCARGSCPHDDCQCYLHQVPAEGAKQVESRSFLKRKAAMQGKPIPTFAPPTVEVYQGFIVVKCDELIVQIGPEDTDEDAEFVANVMRKILDRVAARAPHQPKPVNSCNITPQQLTSETCPRCFSRGQECTMCRHAREDYEAS